MNDKELFEQLERGPLTRDGFDEALRRRINESLDKPSRKQRRPWFVRWSSISAACLLIVAVAVGLWSWKGFNSGQENNQSLVVNPTASSSAASDKEIDPIPHSAVVIGLREDSPDGTTSNYRTLLVAPQNERITYMGSVKGVWMPYKTSFWKIDSVSDSLGKGTESLQALRNGTKTSGEIKLNEATSQLRRTEKLLFAGNKFLSILQTTNVNEKGVAAEQSQVWVNQVSDLEPVVRAKDIYSLENNHFTLSEAIETNQSEGNIDQWAIVRESGKWVAKQRAIASVMANVSDVRNWETISVPLTAQVTGNDGDTLRLTEDEIRRLEPNAIDAYTSNNEEVAVMITNGQIKIVPYRLDDSERVRQTVNVPISANESVVMVQWAVEQKYVESWKQLFSKWLTSSAEQ